MGGFAVFSSSQPNLLRRRRAKPLADQWLEVGYQCGVSQQGCLRKMHVTHRNTPQKRRRGTLLSRGERRLSSMHSLTVCRQRNTAMCLLLQTKPHLRRKIHSVEISTRIARKSGHAVMAVSPKRYFWTTGEEDVRRSSAMRSTSSWICDGR